MACYETNHSPDFILSSPNINFLIGLYCIGIIGSLFSPSHVPYSMLATQATQ